MRPTTTSTSPPPHQDSQFPFLLPERSDAVFTFDASSKPDMALKFPPRPPAPRPGKRGRAATDIDGEHSCLYKKKRRLRLFLITSRLSPQYSHPATNIVDRGSSKIAVWAKQKALGRNLLRKAAILNRIRRRPLVARSVQEGLGRSLVDQEKEQKQLELARLAFTYGSHDAQTRPVFQGTQSFPPSAAAKFGGHLEASEKSTNKPSSPNVPSAVLSDDGEAEKPSYRSPNDAYASSYAVPRAQIPKRPYIPLPPSPLGLSNYDAFDLEDDIPDPYSHLDDDDEEAVEADANPWFDESAHSPPTSRAASFSSTVSTAPTGASEVINTPPQMIYSDFNVLDHLDPGEPVVGDHDQIDEGLWPNNMIEPGPSVPVTLEPAYTYPASSSPNFTALLAPSVDMPGSSNSPGGAKLADVLDRQEEEVRKERERQKSLMFLRFNS